MLFGVPGAYLYWGTVGASVEHTLMLSHPRARPVWTECPVPRGYRSAMDKIVTQ